MPSVAEAQSALDAVNNRRNEVESDLLDALGLEKDLSAQVGRLIADGENAEAVRQSRDAARQQVEDLESATAQLAGDVAAAQQGVNLARIAEAHATMQEQVPLLESAAKDFEQALQDVRKHRAELIAAGSKMRGAALAVGDPSSHRFGMEQFVVDAIRDHVVEDGGSFGIPVPLLLAAVLQDARAI